MEIKDPYSSKNYEAALIPQFDFSSCGKVSKNENDLLEEHLCIDLTKDGIEVKYNPEKFIFSDEETKTVFSRQIATIFIKNGFLLDGITERKNVYKMGTSRDITNEELAFMFNYDEDMIEKEMANEINKAASFVILGDIL